MKRLFCILLVIVILLSSCKGEEYIPEQNTKKPIENIDYTKFTTSDIVYETEPLFINAPGMVIYMSQGSINVNGNQKGALLSYINKASDEAHIFCFDPLCNHENCIAKQFHMSSNIVYNEYSKLFYSVKMEDFIGGRGTNVYSFDTNSNEAQFVYSSDGNEIQKIFSSDKYVVFLQQNKDGGCDLVRIDTSNNTSKKMDLPNKKTLNGFYVIGNKIIFTFSDDIYWYETDITFSNYTKLKITTADKPCFFNTENMYAVNNIVNGIEYTDEYIIRRHIYANFYKINMQTGETTDLYSENGKLFNVFGMNSENIFIYYWQKNPDESSPTKYIPINEIYSINLATKEKNLIYSFDPSVTIVNINFIYDYDGILYLHYDEINNKKTECYASLKQNENDKLYTLKKYIINESK